MNKHDIEYILNKSQIAKHFPVLMGHPQGVIYYITKGYDKQEISQVFARGYKFDGAFARVKRLDSQDLEYMDIVGNISEKETEFGNALYNFVVEIHKGGLNIHAFDTIPEHLFQDENFMENAP